MKNIKQLIVINLLITLILLNFNSACGADKNKVDQKIFSPNGCNYLFYKRVFDNSTKLFVYNGHLKKSFTIAEVYLRYPLDILWHNDDLLEINIKTGSPGNFSIFYSAKNNKISKNHYFPLAVDPNRYLVLLGQENVYIIDIFNISHRYTLNYDFKKTAIKWLIFDRKYTYFDENGNLFIKYKNDNNEWVTRQLEQKIINLAE